MSLIDFEKYLLLKKSPLTVKAYLSDLRLFFEFCRVKSLKKIKRFHIEGFLGAHRASGKQSASLYRYFMSIKAYFAWLSLNQLIDINPCQGVEAPRSVQKVPNVPTLEEVERLFNSVSDEGISGLRDRAILELLYSSGLRVSELCALNRSDLVNDTIIIRLSKRGKWRTVPLTTEAWVHLQTYLENRVDERPAMFTNNLGRAINRLAVYRMVERRTQAIGRRFTPHCLRHAFATHMLDEGADLRLIQELLGHASIATTQRYTHLSAAQMATGFNKFHPRCKIQEAKKCL